jgi:predicted enzyme related to lactoylglutathione lyase
VAEKGEILVGKRESYEPGTFCWADLTTTDAEAFYGDLFGWKFRDDEIPGGVYTKRHGDAVGASSRDDAIEKARGLGGTVLAGPLELPSGKIAVLGYPQGAAFAVFEGETDE